MSISVCVCVSVSCYEQAVMSMMDEMDLIKQWKIPRTTIAR